MTNQITNDILNHEKDIIRENLNSKFETDEANTTQYNEIPDFLNIYPNHFITAPDDLKNDNNFLGSGAGGSVIKVVNNETDYACKIIKLIHNYQSNRTYDSGIYDNFIREIAYQEILSPHDIAPKIIDYFYFSYSNNLYGIIIMEYLKDYYTFSEFKKYVLQQTTQKQETIYSKYNRSLNSLLYKFTQLNIFIHDFQFMIKTDGTIKLIDFGNVTKFQTNTVLKEGESDFAEKDIIFTSQREYKDNLANIFNIPRQYLNLHVPTLRPRNTLSKSISKPISKSKGKGLKQKETRKPKKQKETKKPKKQKKTRKQKKQKETKKQK